MAFPRSSPLVLLLLVVVPAWATDVTVVGLFSGKAVVTVNRGAPRILAVGQSTPEGVKLVSADANGAVLEIDGRKQTLEMGQHYESPSQGESRTSVTLAPDSRGHYLVSGQVNGGHIRFLVDTGATTISLSASDARRLGIDYLKGEQGYAIVADGRRVRSWRVKLDSVTVGAITLYGVEASIGEGGMDFALLGMSFLSRTDMQRAGPNLVLTKRY